jgi:hypothetical protein
VLEIRHSQAGADQLPDQAEGAEAMIAVSSPVFSAEKVRIVIVTSSRLSTIAGSRPVENRMNRRVFVASGIAIAAAVRYRGAHAAAKVVRIGWLTAQRASSLAPFLEAFRNGLAEFGYRENDNLEIDYRYGDDNLLRVAPLAAELARKPVDLLVVQGAAVPMVYELRLSIPAVYVFSGDPVVPVLPTVSPIRVAT